jgi:hypothetical protein
MNVCEYHVQVLFQNTFGKTKKSVLCLGKYFNSDSGSRAMAAMVVAVMKWL